MKFAIDLWIRNKLFKYWSLNASQKWEQRCDQLNGYSNYVLVCDRFPINQSSTHNWSEFGLSWHSMGPQVADQLSVDSQRSYWRRHRWQSCLVSRDSTPREPSNSVHLFATNIGSNMFQTIVWEKNPKSSPFWGHWLWSYELRDQWRRRPKSALWTINQLKSCDFLSDKLFRTLFLSSNCRSEEPLSWGTFWMSLWIMKFVSNNCDQTRTANAAQLRHRCDRSRHCDQSEHRIGSIAMKQMVIDCDSQVSTAKTKFSAMLGFIAFSRND